MTPAGIDRSRHPQHAWRADVYPKNSNSHIKRYEHTASRIRVFRDHENLELVCTTELLPVRLLRWGLVAAIFFSCALFLGPSVPLSKCSARLRRLDSSDFCVDDRRSLSDGLEMVSATRSLAVKVSFGRLCVFTTREPSPESFSQVASAGIYCVLIGFPKLRVRRTRFTHR